MGKRKERKIRRKQEKEKRTFGKKIIEIDRRKKERQKVKLISKEKDSRK